MSVSVTGLAWGDVNDIADYLDGQSAGVGGDFLDRFQATLTILEQFPRLYGRVARCPRGREIRCAPIGRTMYLVIYEVRADDASVFAIIHGRRRQHWRSRL
jgi:plasmid stabilization system protein ParE